MENPAIIKELSPGLVGLIVKGDYSNIMFKTINTFTDQLVDSFEIPMLSFDVLDNMNIIFANVDYNNMETKIKIFNHTTNSTNTIDFITSSNNQIVLPYGIDISISSNEVYITDADDFSKNWGRVFVFDLQGNYKDKVNFSLSSFKSNCKKLDLF